MRAAALLLFLAAPLVWSQAPLEAALAAEHAGRTQSAIAQFQAILRASPSPEVAGQARLELVRIYQRRGQWFQAAGQLQELRKLVPAETEYAYQLGVAYRSLSKWAFERMQALAPRSARVQQVYGEQYAIAGDFAKAAAAFKEAIGADPKLPGSHLALAVLYLRQNQRDQALAEVRDELAIAPESAVAKQLLQSLQAGPR